MKTLPVYLFIISISLAVPDSAALSKLSQDQFIKNENNSEYKMLTMRQLQRPTRSYGDLDVFIELWPEPPFSSFIHPHQSNSIGYNLEKNGHITPDFSNGLNYPDSLLLTGLMSQRAVSYLYSRELFFGNIPHVRAILRNQQERRANGLADNRISSARIDPSFRRFRSI